MDIKICRYIYINIYICMCCRFSIYGIYILRYGKRTNGNGNFHFSASNGKQTWQTSVCFLQTEIGKRKFFSLDRQKITGSGGLLFHQRCPSLWLSIIAVPDHLEQFTVSS